ncbi:MAG: N-6 DNA methylase, partial [Deltaproteobacteria bacterium]|nr:N-6 DNA methylase [Deltaproteobacteria bacterium]
DQVDCKVLDPACGSGIFLVEIYRRLIAHWQQANPSEPIQFKHLKKLLVDNIYGVDLDSGAIQVAAFSLYLTLCDFLEPRQIWKNVTFPPLRNQNLFLADFFNKGKAFSDSKYDLIVGNPPWKSSLTEPCKAYILERQSDFPDRQYAPDNQVALTFLWRAAELCEPTGEICLLLPSKGLLFNRSQPHIDFREDFLSTYHVTTIINLSAYRRILFSKGIGAGAAVYYTPSAPQNQQPILYCSPKPAYSIEDRWQFIIDPYDIAELPRDEARQNNLIWKIAMWGGPRDYELINKLQSPPYQTLEAICENQQPKWIHGEGIIVGNKAQEAKNLLGKPFLDLKRAELNRFIIDEDRLPIFDIPKLERPRTKKPEIFEGPHILIKQSPKTGEKSFRAALLINNTVFRHSLIGIHGSKNDLNVLAQCCLALNSHIPLYYGLMTSGRWLVERDELDKIEIMNFPMPSHIFDTPITYQYLEELASDLEWETKVQDKIGSLYNLTVDESILINDAINYTLDYFRRGNSINPTYSETTGESHLEKYLTVAQRTLANSFSTPFQGTIFSGHAPVRVIGLRAKNRDEKSSIHIEVSAQALENALDEASQYLQEQRLSGVFIQRHIRAYVGNMIYIIKPDQRRYWTQAIALRDADEIYADIMAARESVA